MVRKINIFLWLVVFFYLIYALVMEGPTAKMIGLLVLAVLAVLAQIIGWRRKKK
ncbi:hypothetical protein ACG98G_05470 [Megasphaera hexanoica]|jgi:hypothetical protein|uniref:Uncharacterized protein n=1 Tax=Megasphaera hexanoica TaxID=1675036 RepID=A0A848BZE7_9FIRM|nr:MULTISPECIES: hypothetical protein [Megasphaera]MCI5531854.1 hypothetical protein [Caecibacter massiliensis]NME28666.1 hypothetical protein [Megasphaera hexanoica]